MKSNRKNPFLIAAITLAGIAFTTTSAVALDLTWDPSTDPGIQAGGGSWDTSSAPNWTSDAGATNVDWSQTDINDGSNTATFAGTDGLVDAYEVTLASQMAVESLTFNSTGYKITGSTLALLPTTATNAPVTVAANKTATINSTLVGFNTGGAPLVTLNSGSVLNLGGGFSTGQFKFAGAGTLNITGGTSAPNVPRFDNAVINHTGGTVNLTSNAVSYIGYAGSQNSTYTISGTGILNANSGSGGTNGGIVVGRALSSTRTATLTVDNGGQVNVGTIAGRVGFLSIVAADGNSNGLLEVKTGGTLTVGTGSSGNALILFQGGANAGKTSTVNQSGGISTINAIQFGGTSNSVLYDATSLATLQLSGGSLYVGQGGITRGTGTNAATLPITIKLLGGTFGASAPWSSSLDMKLGTATIQAASSTSVAQNIALSGILSNESGAATLTKTGNGVLTLSGANSYTGATSVNAGTLLVNAPGSLDPSSAVTVAGGAALGGNGTINGTVNLAANALLAPGGSGTIGTLTLANNSASSLALNGNSLFFDLPNTLTASDLVAVTGGSGVLTLNGANKIVLNAPSGPVPAGSYTLMTYSATTGSGTLTFQNGTTTLGNATLNVGPTSVTLNVGVGGLTGLDLVWKGDLSGEWDNSALNWTRDGTASQAYVNGDAVVFDDSGSNAATISSAAPVAPSAVYFNNVVKNYTVSAVIDGVATLNKLGPATTTLTGLNTFTGATTIGSGTLQLSGAGKLGFTAGTSGTYAGAMSIAPNATFETANSGTQTLGGAITDGGTLKHSGGSGLILSNAANSYGALNISNANSRVFIDTNAGALPDAATVNIASGALVFDAPAPATRATAVTVSSGAALSARDATTLSNVTLPGAGSVVFNNDDADTTLLTINNGQTLTGALTVQIGGMRMAPGTLALGGVTLAGNLTGVGGLVVASSGDFAENPTLFGTGVLTLSGACDYTGTTTVTAGTLAVTGSLGATAVTVSSPAILGGNGNIGGDVTIDSGATHALAVAATPGTQVTRAITGTLNLTAGNLLDLTAAATPADGVYVLATAPTISGTIDNANIDYNGITGTVSIDTASSPDRLLLTVTGAVTNDYASWANDPTKGNIPGEPASGDFDNDGITNIVEYALGMNPRVSSQPAGVLASNVITYTKGADAIANGDVSWVIETSQTLADGSWTPQVTQPAADPALTIAYTLTPGTPAKNFARLKVVQVP